MSREHLGRAAKVVSVEVGRKRTCRELNMEMTPAARADHSKTVNDWLSPLMSGSIIFGIIQSCLWSLMKAMRQEESVPELLRNVLMGTARRSPMLP